MIAESAIYIATPTDIARKVVLTYARYRRHPIARKLLHEAISLHRQYREMAEVPCLASSVIGERRSIPASV